MTDPKPKRRRRWYQFSLRTLMLFMLVCAVLFGWVGKRLEETRREQLVVARIESWGGGVAYHGKMLPPWIANPFRKVRVANLMGTQVTDAGLVHLKDLTSLEVLRLDITLVTDTGLMHLKRLTNIEVLWLGDTEVTDAGLEHLL